MVSTALSLAVVTTIGCMLVYNKLPRKVRRLMEKYSLMTDLFTLIAVYALLGGTLTALMAGAFVGVFVSIMLHIANHSEDFLYLYDLRDFIKEKAAEAKVALNAYGETYRQRKELLNANLHEVSAA